MDRYKFRPTTPSHRGALEVAMNSPGFGGQSVKDQSSGKSWVVETKAELAFWS